MNYGLHLKEVLVVPDFKHNLLSLNKLAKNENCRVHFYEEYCVILDNVSQQVKGLGKSRNGLYYLLDAKIEDAINRLKCTIRSNVYHHSTHANQPIKVEKWNSKKASL